MRFCSSFSAIARSFSTARARRAKPASSAACWIVSRVGGSLGRLEGLLEIGRGSDRRHAHGHQLETEARQGVVGQQTLAHAPADALVAVDQQLADPGAGDVVEGELLGQGAEHVRELLQRLAQMSTVAQIDAEVDALGQQRRLDDAIGQHALHGHVLKVGRAPVKDERELAVVDRNLDHRGVERAKPKRGCPATAALSAVLVLDDVRARFGP